MEAFNRWRMTSSGRCSFLPRQMEGEILRGAEHGFGENLRRTAILIELRRQSKGSGLKTRHKQIKDNPGQRSDPDKREQNTKRDHDHWPLTDQPLQFVPDRDHSHAWVRDAVAF